MQQTKTGSTSQQGSTTGTGRQMGGTVGVAQPRQSGGAPDPKTATTPAPGKEVRFTDWASI